MNQIGKSILNFGPMIIKLYSYLQSMTGSGRLVSIIVYAAYDFNNTRWSYFLFWSKKTSLKKFTRL